MVASVLEALEYADQVRILVEAVSLLLPGAGVRTYVHNWTAALTQAAASRHEIALFPFLPAAGTLVHDRPAVAAFSAFWRLGLVRAENRCGGWFLTAEAQKFDIFHATNTHVVRPPSTPKLTATIHDLSCWITPDAHLPATIAESKVFADRVLKRADRIMAVSENTKMDAVRILGLQPDRIEVVYPGAADAYFEANSAARRRVRRKYGLVRPYILFVGTREPRKNLGTLIDAYRALPRSFRGEFELVLAGRAGWITGRERALIENPPDGVRPLGYVPEADLPGITAAATIVAYPSLYEGFGLPLAQAMAAGAPIIASAVSAIPEVVADAGLLVDPLSRTELTAGLERLLSSPTLRAELAAAGRLRAECFRWRKNAMASLGFFQRAWGDETRYL